MTTPTTPLTTCFYSAKGGAGSTVTAAVAALALAVHEPVDLVDHGGDMLTVFGLPSSAPTIPARLSGEQLVARHAVTVWPDAGTAEPAAGSRRVHDVGLARTEAALAVLAEADERILVIRACYLSLRRAQDLPVRPTGVLLLLEPGRALGAQDVEHVLGVPVLELAVSVVVARSVDAGLVQGRPDRDLTRTVEALVTARVGA